MPWTTTGCCWSLAIASPRSTWCCPRPSRTRAGCSPGLSRFWFARTAAAGDRAPTTCWTRTRRRCPPRWAAATAAELRGRLMICRRAAPLPVEIIVRGYLSGSGWKDYRATGSLCRHPPAGRPARERPAAGARSSRPSTKAEQGHDENIDFDAHGGAGRGRRSPSERGTSRWRSMRSVPHTRRPPGHPARGHQVRAGHPAAAPARTPTIRARLPPDPHRRGHDARFEPLLGCRRMAARPARRPRFDKQFVRDWLECDRSWDKTPPGPALPDDVVAGTRDATSTPSNASPAPRSERYLTASQATGSPAMSTLSLRRLGDAQATASSTRRAVPWRRRCRTWAWTTSTACASAAAWSSPWMPRRRPEARAIVERLAGGAVREPAHRDLDRSDEGRRRRLPGLQLRS